MKILETISSESGLVVIADSQIAVRWQGQLSRKQYGIEEIELKDNQIFLVKCDQDKFLLWDIGGAGSIDAVKTQNNSLTLVRGWFEESSNSEEDIIIKSAQLHRDEVDNEYLLDLPSGICVVISVEEDGRCLQSEIATLLQEQDNVKILPKINSLIKRFSSRVKVTVSQCDIDASELITLRISDYSY